MRPDGCPYDGACWEERFHASKGMFGAEVVSFRGEPVAEESRHHDLATGPLLDPWESWTYLDGRTEWVRRDRGKHQYCLQYISEPLVYYALEALAEPRCRQKATPSGFGMRHERTDSYRNGFVRFLGGYIERNQGFGCSHG